MTSHHDDLRAIRAFRAEDAAPDADARASARVALLERIEAVAPTFPAQAVAAPRKRFPRALRPRPRRLLAGGLGLAASAAAVLALVAGLGSGGVGPDAASAAEALRGVAVVAAEGPDTALRDGQYWFVASEVQEGSRTFGASTPSGPVSFTIVDVRTRTQRWIDRSGAGRTVTDMIGEPRFATSADREAWIAAGRPPLASGGDGRFAAGVLAGSEDGTVPQRTDGWTALVGLSYAELRALPVDEGALADRLARASAGRPGGTFGLAVSLLRTAPVSPEQRAALYGVLASVPDTQLLGTVQDEQGRSGTGVVWERDGVRVRVVFDPHTGTLLDVERTTTDPQRAGAVAPRPAPSDQQETLLAAGVVDSDSAHP